jgi:hypothetical protein
MLPFIGSEALAAGALSRGALRWNHSRLHPDVYLANGARRDVHINTMAAWLYMRRRGIVAGHAAAALHGVEWIGDDVPVELIAKHGRPRLGLVIYEERISDDEIQRIGDLDVTTPARTALDLARRLPRDEALETLDALAARTGVTAGDVAPLVDRYRGARGIASCGVLSLMDGGASSPQQTRLRLMMLDAGLPRPRTSIFLADGSRGAVLSMGWCDERVALEHDDDLSGLSPSQRIDRDDLIQSLGWVRILAHAGQHRSSVVSRVRRAIQHGRQR